MTAHDYGFIYTQIRDCLEDEEDGQGYLWDTVKAHWPEIKSALQLASDVQEANGQTDDYMCPNCVTPWKCNGPHQLPKASE